MCIHSKPNSHCLSYKYAHVSVQCDTFANGSSIERCYKFYDQNIVYFDAQELCKEKGGHVMEITSAVEEDIMNELLPSNLLFGKVP